MRDAMLFLVFALATVARVTGGEELKAPCKACDDDATQPAIASEDLRVGKICPLWEADYNDDGSIMYYCNRFPDNGCQQTPTADYVNGFYAWPIYVCSNCIQIPPPLTKDAPVPVAAKPDGAKPAADQSQEVEYGGFDGPPKPLDFEPKTLIGKAGQYSETLTNSKIRFVRQKGTDVYAKVFVRVIDIGAASGTEVPGKRLSRYYLAYEVEEDPTEEDGEVVELEWNATGSEYIFSAKWEPAFKPVVPILILRSEESK